MIFCYCKTVYRYSRYFQKNVYYYLEMIWRFVSVGVSIDKLSYEFIETIMLRNRIFEDPRNFCIEIEIDVKNFTVRSWRLDSDPSGKPAPSSGLHKNSMTRRCRYYRFIFARKVTACYEIINQVYIKHCSIVSSPTSRGSF